MLGSVKHNAGWIWQASGKHPAAKDFLEIGSRDPLLQAFTGWVAGGFRQWAVQNDAKATRNSWRFWTRAAHRQHLICGVSRDSCDSFGRSFPLVLVGCGYLRKWQAHWELLPLVLDKTWQQMEYLATKRMLDFNHLEDEVRMLPLPADDWSGVDLSRLRTADAGNEIDNLDNLSTPVPNPVSVGSDPMVGMMPLANILRNEPSVQLAELHSNLKKRLKQPPNAVFMGGDPEHGCLVWFNRPLRKEDFTTLWTSWPQASG